MSTADAKEEPRPLRLLALSGALITIGSFLSVLYPIVDVVSDQTLFLVVVVATLLAASGLTRRLTEGQALAIAGGLFALGMGWYLLQVDAVTLWLWPHVAYTVSLLTGRSILGIVGLETWMIAVTPAPIFLTWYLSLRRRYVASAVAGGAGTLFFVLTGDASPTVALLGVIGVFVLVGVGELERLEGSLGDADAIAAVVALAIVVPTVVTIVPSGGVVAFSADTGLSGSTGGGGGGDGTLEASLLGVDDRLDVGGSIELEAELRFAVESDRESYWRVGAYDLYTGDGWVRQGTTGSLDRRLGEPPGRSIRVEQRYQALATTNAVPAVWRPAAVSGWAAENARVTRLGGLSSPTSLAENETYGVRSAVPDPTYEELQGADGEVPESVRERYLQLPDSMPERVADRTTRLTADAETSYETARTIEQWLENNRGYSLNVSEPSGSIADAFLFEMERGYCTYYATTMTAMLRTQDIPARFVVGYSPGQRVAEDEWVVRSQNAHAWVEVYFPDIGWVQFDPTPGGPRSTTADRTLETARENNASNVDTNRTRGGEYTPSTAEDPETGTLTEGLSEHGGLWYGNPPNVSIDVPTPRGPGSVTNGTNLTTPTSTTAAGTGNGSSGPSLQVPSAEQATLGLLTVVGLAGLARRTGLSGRAYRTVWLRYQPRGDPEADIERAHERLLYLLSSRHRDRRPSETPRAYLAAIDADERARRVVEIRELARYAGVVDPEAAEEAVELVDELVAE